jgi:F-type H+-transporting ATPase subunit b
VDINATLFGQMITFALFVWFTMKFIWPIMEKTLKDRQEKIAQGLMAAERGHKELEIAKKTATTEIRQAREQAASIVEQAHKQAVLLLEEAKESALQERERILQAGRNEVEQERRETKSQLRGEIVQLVTKTTEKLLARSLTDADQKNLLEISKRALHD